MATDADSLDWREVPPLPDKFGFSGPFVGTHHGALILAYRADTDTWKPCGEMPVAHVTTAMTQWDGPFVMPSGEVRPGVRSPRVWTMQVPP